MKLEYGKRRSTRLRRNKKQEEPDLEKSTKPEQVFNKTSSGQTLEAGSKPDSPAQNLTKIDKSPLRSDFDDKNVIDPILKLEMDIEAAQEDHRNMIKANQLIRQGDIKGLEYLLGKERAAELQNPGFNDKPGFPEFRLKESYARICKMKIHLEELQDGQDWVNIDFKSYAGHVYEDLKENRIRIIFNKKPPAGLRARLKANGFKWSRSLEAWQKKLTERPHHLFERTRGEER